MKSTRNLVTALIATAMTASAMAQLKPPPQQPAAAPAPAAKPAGENAAKQEAGGLAAAGWLVLLDRKDWGRAWETSASMFQKNVPLGSWMDGGPKVREPLGAF